MKTCRASISIHEIAAEFDRLFADDSELVDATETGYGLGTEAGYVGHADDNMSVVGWYGQAGNVGHPVMAIANEHIQLAGEVLAEMATARSLSEIEAAFVAAGVRFERLA